MQRSLYNPNASFGTMPVFMTAISTILGAILFLRFGYAVGHVGFIGVIGIIIIGHMITLPTALAVAEIATNQKVQGGGAYFIISRSFGFNIGGTIGITLFLSQAVSVAFYIIAFGEAFDSILPYFNLQYPPELIKKVIALMAMTILAAIVLARGANIGMKALYFVVFLLFTSIGFFLFGEPDIQMPLHPYQRIEHPDSFFYVFTIIFPAFTGLAAGLGLSGDLKNPQKSIPHGTLWATVAGMIVYIIVAYKLAISATPEELANDQLIMQKIALWGPIIPIGLAAATLSSAIGSVLVAPRTLQAIGYDHIFPTKKLNLWLSKGKEKDNEPVNSSIITILIAYAFIFMGDINSVARIISMFFMVTYGAICLISFLEYFAADPSYRPTFKQNKWYFSLLGFLLSVWLMMKMDWAYAMLSLIIMGILYTVITKVSTDKKGLERLFKGVVFQLSRQIQIFVQRANKEDNSEEYWRPFIICVSPDSFKRRSAFDLLRWISYKHGFGTYIHYISGLLNKQTYKDSQNVLNRLIALAKGSNSRVYLDTIISPSYTSAIAQVIQLSGISGKGNNLMLFEFASDEPENLKYAVENFELFEASQFDVCILSSSIKGFGYNREIHVWITPKDYHNANLMILLAYIMLGHKEWQNGIIKIFALFPADKMAEQRAKLLDLIKSGRLPISPGNIQVIHSQPGQDRKATIRQYSIDADLTILGFTNNNLEGGNEFFIGYNEMGNMLFVNAFNKKRID